MKNTFKSAMIWFTGVIEDADDPMQQGRCRVRCYGYHNPNKEELPTQDLHWANIMMPVTSASISGIGESATGLIAGSWVIGFFRDGPSAQDPVIMGTIPSRTPAPPSDESAFADPYGFNPRIPNDDDIPKMATNNFSTSSFYIQKKELKQEKVEMAIPPKMSTVYEDDSPKFYQRRSWNTIDPDANTKPTYPYNHVKEYECGHIFEVDETKGHERLLQAHKSGTYEEIIANGDKTVMVIGDDFEVFFKNKNCYVRGNVNITVDGDMRTYVKGDHYLEVEGDKHELIKGQKFTKIALNDVETIGQNKNTLVAQGLMLRANDYEELILDTKNSYVEKNNIILTGEKLTVSAKGDLKLATAGKVEMGASGTTNIVSQGQITIDGGAGMDVTVADQYIEKAAQIYMN